MFCNQKGWTIVFSYRHVITDLRILDNLGDGNNLQHSHSDAIVTIVFKPFYVFLMLTDGLTPYETRLAFITDRFSTSQLNPLFDIQTSCSSYNTPDLMSANNLVWLQQENTHRTTNYNLVSYYYRIVPFVYL